jgi:hypothetical protein
MFSTYFFEMHWFLQKRINEIIDDIRKIWVDKMLVQ